MDAMTKAAKEWMRWTKGDWDQTRERMGLTWETDCGAPSRKPRDERAGGHPTGQPRRDTAHASCSFEDWSRGGSHGSAEATAASTSTYPSQCYTYTNTESTNSSGRPSRMRSSDASSKTTNGNQDNRAQRDTDDHGYNKYPPGMRTQANATRSTGVGEAVEFKRMRISGFRSSDLKVQCSDNVVTIRASTEGDGGYKKDFQSEFTLPHHVDASKLQARIDKDGTFVLHATRDSHNPPRSEPDAAATLDYVSSPGFSVERQDIHLETSGKNKIVTIPVLQE